MENLQQVLDNLKGERAKFIQTAQKQVDQQLAWYDGGIAQLEKLLNPVAEEPVDQSPQ